MFQMTENSFKLIVRRYNINKFIILYIMEV